MTAAADIAFSRQLAATGPGHVLLWSCAGLLMLSAHVGAAVWALQQPALLPQNDPGSPAIMVELAPVVAAPEAVEEQISTEAVDSQAVEAPPTVEPIKPVETVRPVTDPRPAPVEPVTEDRIEPVRETERPTVTARAEPVPPVALERAQPTRPESITPSTTDAPTQQAVEPDVIEPLPEEVDPIEEMVTAALENVEVPLPMARPAPPPAPAREPARAERRPEAQPTRRTRQQQAAPARATNQARIQTQERAPVASAAQTSAGRSASVSPARWQSRLLAHLERRKRYPESARRSRSEGTAYVRFSIDGDGNVGSVSLARSSGIAALDEEVVAMVRRASPVPAPPPGVNRTIMVPVRFNLR